MTMTMNKAMTLALILTLFKSVLDLRVLHIREQPWREGLQHVRQNHQTHAQGHWSLLCDRQR